MKGKVDIITIVIPFSFIAVFCIFLISAPAETKVLINTLYYYVTDKFGILYLWITLISFILCLYLAVSKYGAIKLGEGKKEYSEFSWAAMIFCA